jgi:hypothetical protein
LQRAAPLLLISSANSRFAACAIAQRSSWQYWLLPLLVPSYSPQMWGRAGVWLVIIAMVAIWVAAIYVVIWQPVSLLHLLHGR